jgi:hypothetical protein
LSAIYPTSREKVAKSEHLPVMAVVPAETRYLKSDRELLASLFLLERMIDGGCEIDLGRTGVLTQHGSVEVWRDDQLVAGNPTLPSVEPDRWISLGPSAVAALVRRVRGPDGEPPASVVNMGCFSSTRSARKKGTTFNDELAALLADDGIAIYGPPYAGVVTSAIWLGQWRAFGQRLEDATTVREVPIKIQRIAPAARRRWREAEAGRIATGLHGSVVITNDHALAGEVSSFSPDFAEVRPHDFDRTLME